MKTTSQSVEAMSRHAAQEPSRKPDRFNSPNTDFVDAEAVSLIHRAGESFRRVGPMIRPFIGFLFFGALGALAVGLVSHFEVIVPLEKKLLTAEVRSLATDLDSVVRIRSSLISFTAGNAELDSFLQSGGLDKMLDALRQQFPDFLSFEATDERGQVKAMGGELPLTQPGLFSKSPSGRITTVNLSARPNGPIFHDDPESKCFYITCKHVGSGGGIWFTRTRFSRESVVAVLKSTPIKRVTLIPVAGASKDVPEGPMSLSTPQSCVVRAIGSWWRGPVGAEALLTMPGWLLRVENVGTRPILWRAPIAVPLCLLVCAMIAAIFLKSTSLDKSQGPDEAIDAVADDHSVIRYASPYTEPESCQKSPSLAESMTEKASMVGENLSTLESEADHGIPIVCVESLESECGADLPSVTKLVPIPANKPSIEITDFHGQESCSDYGEESEPIPDTLEVCWFEPCEHCESDNPQRGAGHEGTILSDEEEAPGCERSPESSHLLSITG